MSSVGRSMNRKHLHSVRKCLHKIDRRLRQVKYDTKCTDHEANDAVVKMMSHKDLKIVSQDAIAFEELLKGEIGRHFVGLVQSALLERAMGMTRTDQANDHGQRT